MAGRAPACPREVHAQGWCGIGSRVAYVVLGRHMLAAGSRWPKDDESMVGSGLSTACQRPLGKREHSHPLTNHTPDPPDAQCAGGLASLLGLGLPAASGSGEAPWWARVSEVNDASLQSWRWKAGPLRKA